MNLWSAAIKSTAVALDLNLSTQAAGQVRINRIRVESQCRAPLAGTVFYSPPAGPAEAIGKIGFNLDDPAPTARGLVCGPAASVCPKFSAYGAAYAGGVANPNGKGNWVPKDPKTYTG